MPPAVPRLKRRADFLRVARAGRKWAAPGLVLQVRRRRREDDPEHRLPPIRVGYTASRKVGSAVARNRARRRLRAAAEQVLAGHARLGCDYVVIGRAATLARPYQALIEDLTAALQRLDAYERDAATRAAPQEVAR